MKFVVAFVAALCLTVQSPALAETMVIKDQEGKTRVVTVPDEKNPWVSGISSALITGTGQMWNGEWGKGLLFMGGAVGLGLILSGGDVTRRSNLEVVIPILLLQGYSIYDAASIASEMNAKRKEVLEAYLSGAEDQ